MREAGHKVTPQRLAIITIVLASHELLTPLTVYQRVKQINPHVGEVTVYRTLDILAELGLVCILTTGQKTPRYIGRPAGHHDHLICSGCGKVIDFTGCDVAGLEKKLSSRTGFVIQEHRLDFYGKCADCLNLKTSRPEPRNKILKRPPSSRQSKGVGYD